MYCSKCGKKVEDTDAFCGGCGNQLKKEGATFAVGTKNVENLQWKALGILVIYIILLLAFWYFSRANMFDFSFEEVTLAQFLDKIIYISDMSQELLGLKLFCQICLWAFWIGPVAYLGAAVFAFMNRNFEARICVVLGFSCNVVVVFAILFGMFICADELAELLYIGVDDVFSFIKECLKESFYLYAGLNVMLFVCGLRFSYEAEVGVVVQKKEIKWLIMKMVYTALICVIWYQSQKEMFDIGFYESMSIKDLMDVTSGFSQGVFDSEISYWCFVAGKLVYIFAVVLVWVQKEETAKAFFGLGFVFHFPIIGCITSGLMIMSNSMAHVHVMEVINDEFWIYVALNIAVVICMAAFFSDIEEKGYKKIKHVI